MKEQFEQDVLSFKANMVWRQLCARNSEEEVKAYLSYDEIKEWLSSGKTLNKAYREAQWKIGLKGRTLIQTFRQDFQSNAGLVVKVFQDARERIAPHSWYWKENQNFEKTSIIFRDDKSSSNPNQQYNPSQRYNPNLLPSAAPYHPDTAFHSWAIPLPLWRRAIQIGARVLFFIICLMGIVVGIYVLMMLIWIIFNVWM